MGPKSIFACLQSNPRGLNLTHKGQNQLPEVQTLLLDTQLKTSRSRIDSQSQKSTRRVLNLTHSGIYFKIPLLRCCIFGSWRIYFKFVVFRIRDKVLPNNPSPLGSRVSHTTEREARGFHLCGQIQFIS